MKSYKTMFALLLCVAFFTLSAMPVHAQSKPTKAREIKIAVAAPFSGSAKIFGEEIKRGARQMIEEINKAGGIQGKKVVLQLEDDKGSMSQAVEVAKKLTADPSVPIVIGHFNSACSIAAQKTYDAQGLVELSPGSTNVRLCKGSPWTFRNLYRDDYQGLFLAHYAKKVLQGQRVAVFYDRDDYGTGLMEAFRDEAKKLGLEVLKPVPYMRVRTMDFKALVGQIKDQAPDAIFIAGLFNEAALITLAARRDLGIKAPILSGDGVYSPKFIELAGRFAEGVYVTSPFLFGADKANKKADLFIKKFTKRYGAEPSIWAALTYDAVGMALEAIKQVGTDRKKIRDWLASITSARKAYRGVTGLTFFDKNGDCYSKAPHVSQVKNGRFVVAEKQLTTIKKTF